MKQKLIIMLLTACMALSCTFALAGCNDTPTADNGGTPYPDENASQGLEFALNDDSYWVIGIGTCTDTEIVIPSQYNGLPVTGIFEQAFAGTNDLASIEIPDSVTSIGNYAFYNCSSLTSVTFENTEGWAVDGEPIDVTNPVQNAVYLTDTYLWYTWTRGE